jgi:predicted nucleic acid-binding protein
MIVVSDTTPLIHFGIIKRLDLLRSMYGEIFITKTVFREAVTEGIALGKTDAFLIEREIGKWIKVEDLKGDAGEICSKYRIHRGEAESILLARELNTDMLLMDERDGRQAAKDAGIMVKGTIGVISDCVNRHLLTAGAAVEILTFFRTNPSKFWIDPGIIDIAIRQIEERMINKGEI